MDTIALSQFLNRKNVTRFKTNMEEVNTQIVVSILQVSIYTIQFNSEIVYYYGISTKKALEKRQGIKIIISITLYV